MRALAHLAPCPFGLPPNTRTALAASSTPLVLFTTAPPILPLRSVARAFLTTFISHPTDSLTLFFTFSLRSRYASPPFLSVCSQTAENECKWGGTEGGGQGKFDFSSCDKIRDFATANNAT